MSTEMEAIRGKHADILQQLDDAHEQEATLLEKLRERESQHATVLDQLRVEHAKALDAKASEITDLVAKLN
jgi:hypothetical protein